MAARRRPPVDKEEDARMGKSKQMAADRPPPEKPRMRLRIPQGAKVALKGFDTAVLGAAATITIEGKVCELRQIEKDDDCWDAGKTIEVYVGKCTVAGPAAEPASIDAALKSAQRRVA